MFGIEDETGDNGREQSNATPYMRRSRAVAVRRSRFPWGVRRLLRWGLRAVFVLLPLGAAGYLLTVYALNSPRFQLSSPADVAVAGNHYVPKEEILNALGIPARKANSGINIFRMSLESREKQIDAIPWILSSTIVRSYPHHLAVYVKERKPVAFVSVAGDVKLVDQNGVLLDTPERSHFDFPIIRGLDFRENPNALKSQVDLYLEFMQETSDKMSVSGWTVSEVNLSDPGDLEALVVQGKQTLLIRFGRRDFLTRFKNFLAVLPELRKANSPINSIDLRYNNQVVVNPAGQGSGSASKPKLKTGVAAKKT